MTWWCAQRRINLLQTILREIIITYWGLIPLLSQHVLCLPGCPQSPDPFTIQGSNTTCAYLQHCSGMACCINSPEISYTFQVVYDIDPCEQIMYLEIERLSRNLLLGDGVSGHFYHLWLFGLVRARWRHRFIYKKPRHLTICNFSFM